MIAASVPPASTTSAWPRRIEAAASPIAVEPVAHAETGAKFVPVEPELDRDLAARRVDETRRDEERRDPVDAALGQHLLLLRDRRDPADCRADEDPGPRSIDVLEPGVVPGLLRRGNREQDVPIHAARLFRRHELADVEVGHLGGDPDGIGRGVERLDEADAAPPRDGGVPARRRVEPERADGAEAGDRDSPHG